MKFLTKYLLVIVIVLSITIIVLGALTLKSTLELGDMIEEYILEQHGDFERIEIVSADSEGVLVDIYSDEPGNDRMFVDYKMLAIYGE